MSNWVLTCSALPVAVYHSLRVTKSFEKSDFGKKAARCATLFNSDGIQLPEQIWQAMVQLPRYPWENEPVKYHAAHNVSVPNLWVDKCLADRL